MRSPFRWSIVLVPIVVIGAIELLSDSLLDEAFPFPLDALVVVAFVAGLSVVFAALAFRQIDALTGDLDRRNAELEDRVASARALHRVSVAVAASADIDSVLGVVVESARDLLRADAAFLLLPDADGTLRLRVRRGPPDAFVSAGAEPTAEGEPGDPEALRFLRPGTARAHLAAPLQRGDSTIGQLAVAGATARSFSVDDVEALASLAYQAAIALENARLQGRLRDLAVIDERERIAREMHDGLAQVLGYVNTKSQAIEEFLVAGRVPEARGHLAELAGAARSLYVDIREAILGLRSPITGSEGLVPAIETYAARFADASKLAVEVRADREVRGMPLEPAIQAQVFRIVQEGLTNVRKHAAAHRASIDFAVAEGQLVVRLADDGRGLASAGDGDDVGALPAGEAAAPNLAAPMPGDVAPRGPAAGNLPVGWPQYGRTAMRERAATIGGAIEWSSVPGGGTVVRLSIPLSIPLPAEATPDDRQTVAR